MGISLSGRKVLVTGGTRGIGRGTVLGLAAAGADVLACYRTPGEHVESLSRQLKQLGGEHHLVPADVSVPEQVRELFDECRQRYGRLDALVHNAGAISHIPFAELPAQEWHRVLDTNLTAAYLLTQQALQLFDGPASVVHIGSGSARAGIAMRAHYTAAKAGLEGLTRSLARELGGRQVRVNVVAPGIITTEHPLPEQVIAKYRQLTAVGRLGSVAEVAQVVVFLVGDESSYITGETIHVDGGI
ncbi:MAG: SDR family oxidoreductase [Micromonosporaceae bacterium]|nr:SDR family oxidoreductase [Micromonosporaceae bacterium]